MPISPSDRRALLAKMKQHRDSERDSIKQINFLLPEPGGNRWNVFALTAQAEHLMAIAGISEAIRTEFRSEYRRASDDFGGVLNVLQDWFALSVRTHDYVPLTEDVMAYYDREVASEDLHVDSFDDDVSATPEEIMAALDKLDDNEAEDQRKTEAQQKAEAMIREQLGLADDELVIVKIVKRKN